MFYTIVIVTVLTATSQISTKIRCGPRKKTFLDRIKESIKQLDLYHFIFQSFVVWLLPFATVMKDPCELLRKASLPVELAPLKIISPQ